MRLPLVLRRKMDNHRSRFKIVRALKHWHYLADVFFENHYIKYARFPNPCLNKDKREEKIVVSLTSYPARMEQAYYAIKSLMLQTLLPDRIILWLSELQFPDRELPEEFQELINKGLEVRFTSDDLRSHKKYYYMLQEQGADEVVVTYDDDIIYDKKSLERIYRKHMLFPHAVVCDYGMKMCLEGCTIMPYNNWEIDSIVGVESPSMMISPYTGAGCLYPFGIMPSTTFDKVKLRELAFSADDIWMNFNEIIGDVPVVKTRPKGEMLCMVYGSQLESLGNYNNQNNGNDEAVRKICREYPQIMDKLKGANREGQLYSSIRQY